MYCLGSWMNLNIIFKSVSCMYVNISLRLKFHDIMTIEDASLRSCLSCNSKFILSSFPRLQPHPSRSRNKPTHPSLFPTVIVFRGQREGIEKQRLRVQQHCNALIGDCSLLKLSAQIRCQYIRCKYAGLLPKCWHFCQCAARLRAVARGQQCVYSISSLEV